MMITTAKNLMKVRDVKPDAAQNKITTLIAETAQFRGDLVLQESVHIKGKVLGNVTVQGEAMLLSLNIGALIEGDVQADIITVGGTINGNITARLLKLQPTAIVNGQIKYERLLVDDGAAINSSSVSNVSTPVVERLAAVSE